VFGIRKCPFVAPIQSILYTTPVAFFYGIIYGNAHFVPTLQIARIGVLREENKLVEEEANTIQTIIKDLSSSCPKPYNRCLEDQC
jgi:hypothetical protein